MTMEKLTDNSAAAQEAMDEDVFRADSDDEVSAAEPITMHTDGNFAKTSHLSLKEQARQLVINVREYFRRERENRGPLLNPDLVLERTCAALKVTPGVVVRVTRPVTHPNNTSRPGTGCDYSTRLHPLRIDAIKNFVEMYYRTDPTASMTKAYEKIVRSGLFSGAPNTLRRILHKEGFEFVRGKAGNGRYGVFKKVKREFLFEDYLKQDEEAEKKLKEGSEPKLEPLVEQHNQVEDLEFFRSVLPSVSKLNDQDKMHFRMAIMMKMHSLRYQVPPSSPKLRTQPLDIDNLL